MNNEIKDKVTQDLKESGGLRAEYIITDNPFETISVKWKEGLFALQSLVPPKESKIIILNSREALDIVAFIKAVHSLTKEA